MRELIDFLTARLADDERKIGGMEREMERARTAPAFQHHPPDWLAGVDIFVSPARWRAEVELKRQMLADHAPVADGSQSSWKWFLGSESESSRILLQLAQPYAGHPGWRGEWRL